MILIDWSGFVIGNIAYSFDVKTQQLDRKGAVSFILSNLKRLRKKFKDYGDVYICLDYGTSWRKEYFQYYKSARKSDKKKSGYDWNQIYSLYNDMVLSMKQSFPYKFIQSKSAEADDIIAYIVFNQSSLNGIKPEKTLIVSQDKDLLQLQKFQYVRQFNPKLWKFENTENPQETLMEHIIKGDRTDGVPNILSDDDALANPNKRQTPIREKRLKELFDISSHDKEVAEKFDRNKKMIDLSEIPEHIQKNISKELLEEQKTTRKSNIYEFLMEYDVINDFLVDIGDF